MKTLITLSVLFAATQAQASLLPHGNPNMPGYTPGYADPFKPGSSDEEENSSDDNYFESGSGAKNKYTAFVCEYENSKGVTIYFAGQDEDSDSLPAPFGGNVWAGQAMTTKNTDGTPDELYLITTFKSTAKLTTVVASEAGVTFTLKIAGKKGDLLVKKGNKILARGEANCKLYK